MPDNPIAADETLAALEHDRDAVALAARRQLMEQAIAEGWSPKRMSKLARLLATDARSEVRQSVATHLAELPDDTVADELAQALADDGSRLVRTAIERFRKQRTRTHKQTAKKTAAAKKLTERTKRIAKRSGEDAAQAAARLASEEIDACLGAAVHDLNHLVMALHTSQQGMETLIANDKSRLAQQLAPHVAQAQERIALMERTLQSMKAYTTPSAEDRQPVAVRVLLDRAIRVVADYLRRRGWDASGIAVVQAVPADLRIEVSLQDPVLALHNVILNAYDAFWNGEDYDTGTIAIEARASGSDCLITITDSGCGMDADRLERVSSFTPTGTGKRTTSKGRRGTGYGLPIAYRRVRDHGGSITMTSESGKGTAVTVILPRQATDAVDP